MTLLLREAVTLLTAAAVWLLAAVALATAGATVVGAVVRRRPSGFGLRMAVIAGLVAAGLAGRFGAPDPLDIELLRRPLPVSWLLGGAVAGAGAAVLIRRGQLTADS